MTAPVGHMAAESGRPECRRADAGKARLDLIPVAPLWELALLYQRGAEKYAVDNWRNGTTFRRAFAALLRHAFKWLAGQTRDPETGAHHLAAVAFWRFALIEWDSSHPELDDRVTDPTFERRGFPE